MNSKGLFDAESPSRPLADRMRPRDLSGLYGQEELTGKGSFLRSMIEEDRPVSIILYGPPGSGKTTLAAIIAARTGHEFVAFSAVVSGVKEVREVVAAAAERLRFSGRKTILFIDEVHRFNRAQQDAFLPHVENGTIILIGATTENPSFEVNSALLSRCKVFTLKRLEPGDIREILRRALTDERGVGIPGLSIEPEAESAIVEIADGDARRALNILEMAAADSKSAAAPKIGIERLRKVAGSLSLLYDKDREEHYNIISALHKSMRGSDPQAALYWLARMLEGGEDPLYIARRMVRFASEDIGLADPQALQVALNAFHTAHFLGMPEADTALAQAAVYLAAAPKSNALYTGIGKARGDARKKGSLPVPMHIRNPVTKWMKESGYGKGYVYPHESPDKACAQEFLPDELKGCEYYVPGRFGFEKEILKRMEYWLKLRKRKNGSAPDEDGRAQGDK